MAKWAKRLGISLLGVLLIAGIFMLDFMRFGGQFRDLEARGNTRCSALPLSASAEDIQIDRARGIAYLSALDRRALVRGAGEDGDILQLDLRNPEAAPVSVLGTRPSGFRPHGMSLYRMGDGNQRLLVISHPPQSEHLVEIFEKRGDSPFVPVARIADPALVSPNAIVALGPGQFYVANDRGTTGPWDRFRELVFRQGFSQVVFFDGERMRTVADGLKSAVGMGMSPDGSRVYVAETLGKTIAVFARDPRSQDLRLLTRIAVDGSPDNINIDPAGRIWVAVHPKLLDLVRHFADPEHRSPTRILRIDASVDGSAQISEVLLDMGETISAGSVGAVFEDTLLIGSITETKVLICRLSTLSGEQP